MTRPAKIFSLPSGSTTQNIDEYITAWHSLAAPIEQAFDVKLIHFDPEFIFAAGNPQRPGIKTVQLQPWFVQRLAEKLTEMEAF
jgi:hypothetical protein